MVNRQTIFKYKIIKGFLHKVNPMLKFFLLLPLSIICMSLPSFLLFIGIIIVIVFAFVCRFSLNEQLTDFKPAFFYAVLMYSFSVLSNLFAYFNGTLDVNYSLLSAPCSLLSILIPHHDFIRIALRLTLIIQLSALFFRTTSSIELRECLNCIEYFIRRIFSFLPFVGKHICLNPKFAENIMLFLSFIPEVFITWSKINLSWKARNGKNGIKKIKMLVFIIISLSFEKAYIKAKAIEARRNIL